MIPLELVVLLESGSRGGLGFLLLLGPLAAIGFFVYVFMRYRNQDKSYRYEDTTGIEVSDVQGRDDWNRTIERTERQHIEGHARTSDPRMRLGSWPDG